MSEIQFTNSYNSCAKKKRYHQCKTKDLEIYSHPNEGIPTLSSSTPSTKMLVQVEVRVLRDVDNTLQRILTQIQEFAETLKEYSVVRNMDGVDYKLAPRLIDEIGDIRRFHSEKPLIAYASIDAPPYQSGQFTGTKRSISKRGSATLRKPDLKL